MKAVLCKEWGVPSSLTLEEVCSPTLTDGEVRVTVHAAGVNPADVLVVAGKYQTSPTLPFSPGFEVAGEVIESRSQTPGLKLGSRVLVTLPYLKHGSPHFGAFASEVIAPATNIVPIPEQMDFVTAAALPVAYGTAHMALTHRAHLQAGETLLITGGTGGTGSAAIQIAKRLGATVIATTSGVQKLTAIKELGADYALDYKTENIVERVLAITNGQGADVIFETVGGDLFEASLQCINWEGRILPIGAASGKIPEVSILQPLVKNCALVGTDFAGYTLRNIERVRQSLIEVLNWYAEGTIKPVAARTMSLASAAEALELVASGKAGGKLVLTT